MILRHSPSDDRQRKASQSPHPTPAIDRCGYHPTQLGTVAYMDAVNTHRFRKLKWWVAGPYFFWSNLVYFGSLFGTGNSHEWWPIFLYPLIYPISAIEHDAGNQLFHSMYPHPTSSDFMNYDYASGAFYIIVGTVWIWFLGWALGRFLNKAFPKPTPMQ